MNVLRTKQTRGFRSLIEPKSQNIFWQNHCVTRADRERVHRHRGATIWFTGLSASGKTTLARAVEAVLFHRGCQTYLLDGDNMRHGLSRDLGFGHDDRAENVRRIGEVAKLFTDFGALVLTALLSPYRADRNSVRAVMAAGDFVEVYVQAPLEVCEQRDPKGLYRKARAGEIVGFTGISAPYEPPESPELLVRTGENTVEACVAQIVEYLAAHSYLTATTIELINPDDPYA